MSTYLQISTLLKSEIDIHNHGGDIMEDIEEMRNIIFKVLVTVLLISIVVACTHLYDVKTERDKADMAIAAGYTVYLDGVEVDPDSVDLDYYIIKVNDFTQSVLLTKPVGHNYVTPITVPVVQ